MLLLLSYIAASAVVLVVVLLFTVLLPASPIIIIAAPLGPLPDGNAQKFRKTPEGPEPANNSIVVSGIVWSCLPFAVQSLSFFPSLLCCWRAAALSVAE